MVTRSPSEGQKPVAWLDALDFQILANAVPGDSLSYRVSSRGNTGDVALYTSPVSQPEQKPVAVKVLEWEGNQATTPFGTYTVTDDVDDLWHFTFHSYPYGVEDDRGYGREAFAKAAAQADYETRIRSALEDAPPVAVKDATARSPLASVTEQAVEAAFEAFWAPGNLPFIGLSSNPQSYNARLSAAIAAALSSLQFKPHPVAGDGWRSIETAPRDGSWFLGYDETRHQIEDRTEVWHWDHKAEEAGFWVNAADSNLDCFPSYWCPLLPAPPVPKQGGPR